MKCEEKIRYNTIKQAWREAYFYYHMIGTETGAYTCRICGKFHLSKKAQMNIPIEIVKDKYLNNKIKHLKYLRSTTPLQRKIHELKLKIPPFKKIFKRKKQEYRELYEQIISKIRRWNRRRQPKRAFKDEVLSHEEMKKALAQLKN